MLSQKICGSDELVTCSSVCSLLIQSNSEAQEARALYSASVEERAIDFYFFERQEIALPPRYTI